MDLATLKSKWVDVLNELEKLNRIAWMAMFDGRLVSLENNVLTLDFTDALKLAGHHDMKSAAAGLAGHVVALETAIESLIGIHIYVAIRDA